MRGLSGWRPRDTIALACLLLVAHTAHAQRLFIDRITSSQGIPHDTVTALYQDRFGYLWIGTFEGLSRFDGVTFVNYGKDDGLESLGITDIAEDRAGRLWVATNGGVARLTDEALPGKSGHPAVPARTFTTFRVGSGDSNGVAAIAFDGEDTLWCATNRGLFRARGTSGMDVRFEPIAPYEQTGIVIAMADRKKALWFGTFDGDVLHVTSGRTSTYKLEDGSARPRFEGFAETGTAFYAATQAGLFLLADDGRGNAWRRVPITLQAGQAIHSILADGDALWIGTNLGLVRWQDSREERFSVGQGIPEGRLFALAKDREGTLWIGSDRQGLGRLSSLAVVSYTRREGLPSDDVASLVVGADGKVYAGTSYGGFARIDEGRAVPLGPNEIGAADRIVRDRAGDWWTFDANGLTRFDGPGLQFVRSRKYPFPADLARARIAWIGGGPWFHEESDGRFLIAFNGLTLVRFDPRAPDATRAFERLPVRFAGDSPVDLTPLIRDRSGALWLGGIGYLGRMAAGTMTVLPVPAGRGLPGTPNPNPRSFLSDRAGRLWIGQRFAGVSVVEDTAAHPPSFRNYSTRDGLPSDAVWALAEDASGLIYACTGKGIAQLDPSTGRMQIFATRDGLAGDLVRRCVFDSSGLLWIATSGGLTRFDPRLAAAERSRIPPPPVYVAGARVNGVPLPLPERGGIAAKTADLPSSTENLQIEYGAVRFRGPTVYQYRLVGADTEWSAPTSERSVTYARIAPGAYRFEVRAADASGLTSQQAATLEFVILSPLWRRPWFIALAVVVALAAGLTLHRLRVRHLLALERIRQQVATDLHDDIGSGLSQIAVLSEVASRRAPPGAATLMHEIAGLARGMRESMGEIVWAIDPRRDRLAELVHRMRHAAFNLLEAADVKVEFVAPDEEAIGRTALGPASRRHLLLAFKEIITNVARHAQATHVRVEILLARGTLTLTVADNGRGFDPAAARHGHGLHNLDARAEALGTTVDIVSTIARGTTIRLVVPLSKR